MKSFEDEEKPLVAFSKCVTGRGPVDDKLFSMLCLISLQNAIWLNDLRSVKTICHSLAWYFLNNQDSSLFYRLTGNVAVEKEKLLLKTSQN